MSSKWEEWIITGGDMPEIDLEEVKEPDGMYICKFCHQLNNNFWWECEGCEDKNGGDGADD